MNQDTFAKTNRKPKNPPQTPSHELCDGRNYITTSFMTLSLCFYCIPEGDQGTDMADGHLASSMWRLRENTS